MPEPANTNQAFEFHVVSHPRSIPVAATYCAYLVTDNWDDWAEFATTFALTVFDEKSARHDFGALKIGKFGLKPASASASPKVQKGHRSPPIPSSFNELDETFFSLGQDDSYYSTLAALNENVRTRITTGLRDMAADLNLWRRARQERVTSISLLRTVKPKSVEGQFHRLATGGVRLTPYQINYIPSWQTSDASSNGLSFNVEPDSFPPTNIHILIGRNGVGKTHMLDSMTKALVSERPSAKRVGRFSTNLPTEDSIPIANLVSVSFSAFDSFALLPENRDRSGGIQYSYIGLRRTSDIGKGRGSPKTPEALAQEFVSSLQICLQGARAMRWKRSIEDLKADPIFNNANITELCDTEKYSLREITEIAVEVFKGLSSGHKIVLLTITRLVETVDEQTLVLLDEPEAHLHPPLLSAFIRALSELMTNRNGVAIIATHSPVVLQEVPKSCVWVLQRSGQEFKAERLSLETFGENVGVLTREVFGLEVTQSGFHNMLSDVVATSPTYESALERFKNEVGSEARAILRALFLNKDGNPKP